MNLLSRTKRSKPIYLFWQWYERYSNVHLGVTTILFAWQLIHLYWLTLAVMVPRIFGVQLFSPGPVAELLIIIADYFEVPALLSATLYYLNNFRKYQQWKFVGYLVLINSQWLHLFWITDEYVLAALTGFRGNVLPLWLAALAIAIDYLELPVIYDTIKQSWRAVHRVARRA